ncbi:2-amino-5-formylamino-6-ribosylaminopyrimidin-4(3H)-one 5'-monophosphate deformylase [uncultured Methanobrevibacter sp.]|uniref:2-amino-5-formylamino-6-ribosylaminopyrimidin- 4(3H)-one 5'-monophosphate deformylase n=1 Tax=uncultured Methanobrevibacter sp. TaxID=253161 RepID=UPI0025E7AD13|nr:2-amino-5-formylamino-6-ribosylaminopyrimidin-4(3H)-one 5'-monophosphate deformylase [uncultured Methanobrevibacter sp.]
MVSLRFNAGNVRDEKVHEIGILALGSHLENHGPALPIDTDAKIASYIAFNASLLSGAKYLGVVYPSYELDEIDHGEHNSIEEVVNEILYLIKSAKKYLHLKKVIIVNGHGGNIPVFEYLYDIETNADVDIILNNKLIETEGPHGGSGELSMGKILGIVKDSQVKNQGNLDQYGEIGLHAFTKARENDPGIENGAKDIEENGVYMDEVYGEQLLSLAINSVLLDIEKLLDY